MSIIEEIRKDREAGTVEFHWIGETLMAKDFGEVVELCSVDWSGLDEFEPEHKRRIARVPDMEAALLAAEELVEECDRLQDIFRDAFGRKLTKLEQALIAYRKATGAE